MKNWLRTTPSSPAEEVSSSELEQSRALLDGWGTDRWPITGFVVARLGCGAVLGGGGYCCCKRETGAGTAAQPLLLRCCSSKTCWLGEGVKQFGLNSAKGVRLGLKNESIGFVSFALGVCTTAEARREGASG